MLYVAIAVAGWVAWERVGFTAPVWLFGAQLVLNAAWTPLFFGAGQYGLGFAELVVLWVLVGLTVWAFWTVRRAAALLLLPYLARVTYAGTLNLAVWLLNR